MFEKNRGKKLMRYQCEIIGDSTFGIAWKAVPDYLCTALQAVRRYWHYIPAHPRFTRMYGVTHRVAFQAILYL